MMKVFELTPKGEFLTAEKRNQISTTELAAYLPDVTFHGGTILSNPLHFASELERNDHNIILFIEPTHASEDKVTTIPVTEDLINWLRGHRHGTSYEAVEAYITDGPR